MSLRVRLIVAAATAVAVAVVLGAAGAYLTTRHELRHQVDVALSRRLELRVRPFPRLAVPPEVVDRDGRRITTDAATLQVVNAEGQILAGNGVPLPVTELDRAIAGGRPGTVFRDATVSGVHLRIATSGGGSGLAVEVAQPLDAVDGTLHRLVLLLTLLALGGVAVAVALGTVVARAALAPVERLTAAAERVATTRDLTATIPVHGADEVARLASTLNSMLVALDESQRAQRRLIADASHELRTPLTSLRTNLEVLARSPDMSAADRRAILDDVIAQVSELGTLVGQLVDLDHSDPTVVETPEPVNLDEILEAALVRARRNAPGLTFTASVEPSPVVGLAGLLERAVSNLLDNAAKWSPPAGRVEVSLAGGVVRVRDHGPGIDPADVPYVFDRFYRSAVARGRPGSGLGLSIVKQAADDHGGRAWVESAPGGGTVACLQIPLAGQAPLEDAPVAPAGRAASPDVIRRRVTEMGT